jgi:hypothetical protein
MAAVPSTAPEVSGGNGRPIRGVHHFNKTLEVWATAKYRRLKRHRTRVGLFLETVAAKQPHLFVYWQTGSVGAVA